MLQNFTVVPASHEQIINLLAQAQSTIGTLDAGAVVTTIADHPIFGQVVVNENVAGPSTIVLHRDAAEKFSAELLFSSMSRHSKN